MPTFDITSTFDKQEVTNAVDQMNRELVNRYDFRDTNTSALLSENIITCLLYTSPSPRDSRKSRMPSSA